ncbi:MAG: hypothetical protein FWE75_12260 [Actinomycetia bacterium]|nr:hypothetical protein [Actinomycetes bacterium]
MPGLLAAGGRRRQPVVVPAEFTAVFAALFADAFTFALSRSSGPDEPPWAVMC